MRLLLKRSWLVALAALAASLAASTSASATGPPASAYIVASVAWQEGVGGGALVTEPDFVSICDKDLAGPGHCIDMSILFTGLAVGTTVWADAASPNFDLVGPRLTNGEPGEILFFLFNAVGGGGNGGLESVVLGDQVGPSGVDLAGYRITRIGFRLDALTVESPGQDLGGDGIWTDMTVRGTWLFDGTIASTKACANNGWQALRGPDGSRFKNQGDCAKLAAVGS